MRELHASWSPSRRAHYLMLALASAALAVACYLTVIGLTSAAAPIGCGPGSGCGAVLASKYSRLFGMPISALAMLSYAVMVAALLALFRPVILIRRTAWTTLVMLAASVTGAAFWFIYLQLVELDAVCPWCMIDHACGLLLAAVILYEAPPFWRRRQAPSLILAGLMMAGVVAWTQSASRVHGHAVLAMPTERDFDRTESDQRHVGLLDGKLHLDPSQEPIIGSPDARHILAVMLDYCCPHCRHTHQTLVAAREQLGGDLAIVLLPTPMNRGCNPYLEDMPHRFDYSCVLAGLAMAVWLAEPGQFEAFDRWLFEPRGPRDPNEAADEAARLVGEDALRRAMADSRIDDMIRRNITAWAQTGINRVPVTLMPRARPREGRIEDVSVIQQMLVESAAAH